MKKTAENYSHINGWGIDADPLDVPNYPIKKDQKMITKE
jgi:hypothetical protein